MKTKITSIAAGIILLIICYSFSTVQNGAVFTLKVSSTKGMGGTVTVYHDTPGTRIEMNMTASGGYTIQKVSIVKATEPSMVYQLDTKTKTYSTADVSNATPDNETANVTVLGHDSLNGYYCTHVKAVQGLRNWEIWNTSAVTEYNQFSAVMNNQRFFGNVGLHDALKVAGAEGFPVKLILTDKDGTTTTELQSTERKTLDASLFTVPADYTKGAAGWPGGGSYPHAGGH